MQISIPIDLVLLNMVVTVCVRADYAGYLFGVRLNIGYINDHIPLWCMCDHLLI